MTSDQIDTPKYRIEFPDFDHEAPVAYLTAHGFEDVSWANDQCPSFECDVFVLWIDFADRTKREFPESPLYMLQDEGNSVLETDSWDDVRAFVEDGKRDFPDYERDMSWALGCHEEVCSLRDGGPVVAVDGKFAIVELGLGGFFLVYGDRDSYACGARSDDEEASEFETLDAAKAEMVLAKAAMEA